MNFEGELPDFSLPKILVAGDIMVDKYLIGSTERISPEAPVPVVNVENEERRLGGAANVASNLSSIGCDVTLIGLVGKDNQGEFVVSELKSKQIKNEVIVDSDIQTITKLRILSKNMQLIRLDFEKKIPNNKQDYLIKKFKKIIQKFDLVIFSDYAKGSLFKINELIKTCNEFNIPTLIDPKQKNTEIYRGATFLKPNFLEFQAMIQSVPNSEEIKVKALDLIQKLNLKALIITNGSKGISLFEKDGKVFEQKAFANEVYDVTGAGDTVIAVLGAFLACGTDLKKSIFFANKAAGIVIGKLGTSFITKEDLTDINFRSKKFLKIDQLIKIVENKKEKNLKITMTNGCFDIIHAGHINYLEKSKKLGDFLIVALNSDASIKKIKGDKRPINNLEDRIAVLSALRCVDYIVCFDEETPSKIIELINPDILVKGADYSIKDIAGAEFILKNGGKVELIEIKRNISTSKLISKLKDL